jgi:hypothetical protein
MRNKEMSELEDRKKTKATTNFTPNESPGINFKSQPKSNKIMIINPEEGAINLANLAGNNNYKHNNVVYKEINTIPNPNPIHVPVIPKLETISNSNNTEYFSAKSEASFLNIKVTEREHEKYLNTNNNFIDSDFSDSHSEIKSKPIIRDTSHGPSYIPLNKTTAQNEIIRRDSFDTLPEEKSSSYNLESEYTEMKEHLKNGDYEKVRDLDRRIVQKEIAKRKVENNLRLDKLKKLEEKLSSEVKRIVSGENTGSYPGMNQLQMIHPNFPGVPKEESKVKLVLVNVNKGEGYSIIQQEQLEEQFHEHKFCDYYFYTKKNIV